MAIELLTRASCHWCGPGTRARWYVPVRGYDGEETDRLGVCDAHRGEVLACGYQVKELGP